jgi:steroid 5-alpha reductase family enzyme
MSNPRSHYMISLSVMAVSACCAWSMGYSLLLAMITTTAVHLLSAIPSIYYQTERYFDLTGMIAVLAMLAIMYCLHAPLSARGLWLLVLCALWSVRLGCFLFRRILQTGSDRRFHQIKSTPSQFIMTWCLSVAWTFFTLLAALCAINSSVAVPLSGWDWLWSAGWVLAFVGECVADWQKRQFRRQYGASRYIDTGLWRYSRHPNYSAEILIWVMIAALSWPQLSGIAYLGLVSPVVVWVLLRYVSGVPMLEAEADRRFGHLASYQAYKANTPCLFL